MGATNHYFLKDHTSVLPNGTRAGYISLSLDGVRVCDFFPFAGDGNGEQFIRQQAGFIVEALNRVIAEAPDEA